MAISLNSITTFTSTKLQAKYKDASRYSFGVSLPNGTQFAPFSVITRLRMLPKEKRFGRCFSVTDSDQIAADSSSKGIGNAENKVDAESVSQTSEGTSESINQNEERSAASPNLQSAAKRPSLTARERLRAARVLSRYTESKASSKPDIGSRVLDALKESERGKKRSRLPEAPTNLFDDSKRGLPKPGLTFQFPGGFDLFIIAFSFVFISSVMFATTYFVWKVGAIHFNEY